MREVESIKSKTQSTVSVYGEWGAKHLDLIWKFNAASLKRERNQDSKEANIEFHEAFQELDGHLRNRPTEDTSSIECLEWLESHKEMVISFAPSGDWYMFPHVKGTFDRHIACYGKTPKDLLARAMKYNFPSKEGFLQMVKDGNECVEKIEDPA